MTRIVIKPPEKDAKVHERNGELLMYIGREDVPSSVEFRWRPGEHQAALT
jgi:hypothetical protein